MTDTPAPIKALPPTIEALAKIRTFVHDWGLTVLGEHDAKIVYDAIAAGQIPGLALRANDGTTCWQCEKCGRTRDGRSCVTCLERERDEALARLAAQHAHGCQLTKALRAVHAAINADLPIFL